MSRTLADLRSAPPDARNEWSGTVCLKPKLLAEVQALGGELESLPAAPEPVDAEDRSGRPKRGGEGENPRAREIRARMAELLDEMAEHEGEIRLRANWTDGEWRRWCDEHPARAEGKPGFDRDVEVCGYRDQKSARAYAYCNADALIEALGDFAHAWNGEPLAADDWSSWLGGNIGGADKKTLARAVVAMYETAVPFKQWRTVLSDSLSRLNGSASPDPSASAPVVSTDGSPGPSSGDATATASPAP